MWVRVIDRSFTALYCLLVLNSIFVSVAPLSATIAASRWPGTVGILIVIASSMLAALAVFRRTLWLRTGLVLLVINVTCTVVTLGAVLDYALLPAQWWGFQFFIVCSLLICGALLRVAGWFALAGCAIGYFWFRSIPDLSGPSGGLDTAVAETLILITQLLIALVVYPVMRGFAESTDRAWAESAESRLEKERQRIARDHQRLVERFLHDEVIHTLRAISLQVGAISPASLRQMCIRAASLMNDLTGWQAEPDQQQDLYLTLDTIIQGSDIALALVSDRPNRQRHLLLPNEVSEAFGGAVTESVRNIVRHAKVRSAEIRVAGSAKDLEVTISDQGVGFETDAIRHNSFGIQRSIRARMTEIGGEVKLHSHLGLGTTVRLRWHGELPQKPGPSFGRAEIADLTQDLRAPLSAIALPILITGLVLITNHREDLRYPLLGMSAYGLLLIIAVVALIHATVKPIGPWMSVGLAVSAVVLAGANGFALDSDLDDYFAFPAAGGVGVLVMLQALFRPLREAVFTEAAVLCVVTLTIWRSTPSAEGLLHALPAIASSAAGAGAAMLFRFVLRRMGRSVQESRERLHLAEVNLSETTVRAAVSTARTARFRSNVLPFLDLVAMGEPGQNPEQIRRRAAVLEAEVRDDLQVGDALDQPTRTRIAAARSAGTEVIINAVGDGLPQQLMCTLLGEALAQGPWGRVVLSVYPDTLGDRVNLLVSPAPATPPPALGRLAESLHGKLLAAADSLVIQTRAGAVP